MSGLAKLFAISVLCPYAQPPVATQTLYNNATPAGLQGEGFITGNRSEGGFYSEVPQGNGGISTSFRQWTYTIADDFQVREPWRVRSVTVWGFQPGIHDPSINTGMAEIRRDRHDGPTVAAGVFGQASMTDVYRIFTDQYTNQYHLQKLTFSINAVLPPGRYWLVYNAFGIPNVDGPQSPFLTKVGAQTTPGANAKVRISAWTLEWHDITDVWSGLPQDIPFWIDGHRLSQIGPVLE